MDNLSIPAHGRLSLRFRKSPRGAPGWALRRSQTSSSNSATGALRVRTVPANQDFRARCPDGSNLSPESAASGVDALLPDAGGGVDGEPWCGRGRAEASDVLRSRRPLTLPRVPPPTPPRPSGGRRGRRHSGELRHRHRPRRCGCRDPRASPSARTQGDRGHSPPAPVPGPPPIRSREGRRRARPEPAEWTGVGAAAA